MGIQSQEISVPESRSAEALDRRAALERAVLVARPTRCLRRMPGRETFVWPAAGALGPGGHGAMIVKRHDERGGALARRLGLRRSRGRREFEVLTALRAAGLPVPRPLFWCADEERSAVAMELVEHRATLRTALAGEPAPGETAQAGGASAVRELVDELAEAVARLHSAGWYHRDLYLEHVLVRRAPDGAGRLVVIDLGRARHARAPRRRWFVKDLAALLCSTPPAVGRAARLRFLARYLDLRGIPRGQGRRAFARAIERKRARLAAHRPRHGERVPEHEAAERELRA